MRLNFPANSFVFGRTNREIAHRTFFFNLQAENFQNASDVHDKQLRFSTHKLWNCDHSFCYKSRRQRTSKMRLNSTSNSFIFGCIYRENAPRTIL